MDFGCPYAFDRHKAQAALTIILCKYKITSSTCKFSVLCIQEIPVLLDTEWLSLAESIGLKRLNKKKVVQPESLFVIRVD